MASGGTGGLFSEVRSGMVSPRLAPIKASGRENSTPVSCIRGAAPAAAVLGAPGCLTPRLRPEGLLSRVSYFAARTSYFLKLTLRGTCSSLLILLSAMVP